MSSRVRKAMALPLLMLGLVQGCIGAEVGQPSGTLDEARQSLSTARTAVVHLFEWKWSDVASECEQYLGPKGFKAVQVSPPNEHISGSEWWTRYQPVSYQVVSRSGNRAAFLDMVTRCHAVGVDVYADLVINHTASGGGTGVAGTNWSTRSHPMYGASDYHSPYCTVGNYQDAYNVQNCDLAGLPDLNTGASYVQQTIANYANDLIGLGVKGFRIDAAKHMAPGDVSGILARFTPGSYVYQEVIDLGGEAVTASQYTGIAAVEEFKYSANIGNQFKNAQIKNLSTFGTSWGMMASGSAMVFVDNHDNQRGHGAGGANVLTYKDGSLYSLANVFMLAWPYGYPRIMSSYDFTDGNQGPPSVAVHGGTLNCFGSTWKCEHRWREIGNMVGFRNAVDGTATANWWDNGNDQIAFSRGNKGYVVINREGSSLSRSFTTGLAAGTYCDVISGDFDASAGSCSGRTITVAANGTATFTVDAMKAAAIHVDAVVGGGGGGGGFSSVYPQLYFRGTPNAWGTTAMTLVANNTWEATVAFSGASTDRFKLDVYGNWTTNFGDNNADGTAEQGGGDIYQTTAGTYVIRFNDSTRAYTMSGSCTPNCTGKVCGSNGCGGSCGTCSGGQSCDAAGQCQQNGGFSSVYAQMNFRGTPNAWSSTVMSLVANNTWETTVTFAGGATERFKFDVFGNWTTNFGDNNADGTAEQSGGDIYVTSAGTYVIRFNDSTRAYTVTSNGSCTPSCTNKACGDDGCGGTCGTCATGNTCNASNQCEPVSSSVVVNFTCNNATTSSGQSVYVTGNHAALGNWNLASAIKLNPTNYPTWTGSVSTLPASTAVQWKCVKRSETNASQNVVWQGGGNNSFTTPASGTTSVSASF
jgi:alpha-amylase